MFKVVIADDEAIILKNLQHIIPWTELGCEVVGTAKNGQQAFELCQKQQIDLLLTDISMPGMTGLELLKKLNELVHIPLTILISGYDEFEYAREGLKWKAIDYILKPVDYEELEHCIERATSQLQDQANKAYEAEKHYFYNLLVKEVKQTEAKALNKPLIPILFEKRMATEQSPEMFVQSSGKSFWYTLSATTTLLLGEWPEEEKQQMLADMRKQSNSMYTVLIGEPVTEEKNVKPAFETLQKWISTVRLMEEAIFSVKELSEKYQSKKSAASAIEKAVAFIDDHFHEDIGAEQVAAYAEMSISYFSLVFKQVTGLTFLEYVTNCRMEKACFFLNHTPMKTYEIAEKVGYQDQRYFSQVFKKHFNQTPSEYRQQTKK